jgi:hypothetical protein
LPYALLEIEPVASPLLEVPSVCIEVEEVIGKLLMAYLIGPGPPGGRPELPHKFNILPGIAWVVENRFRVLEHTVCSLPQAFVDHCKPSVSSWCH